MPMNQLRRDPVSGRWTIITLDKPVISDLISPNHREEESVENCPFCEGNEHMTPPEIMALRNDGFGPNKSGWRIRVIPDKKPVLQIYGEVNNRGMGMYDVLDGIGAHEIVIETPKHNETFVDLSEDQIAEIYWTFKERILDLKEDARLRYILVHKNYGEAVGLTTNHSYSFIIGTPITPKRVKDKLVNARDYFQFKERCIFCDIINQELSDQERIILEDEKFIALAPFASRRPFEVWILPRKHEAFYELTSEYRALANLTKEVLIRVYKLLQEPDYIMALYSGPNIKAGRRRGYWQSLERDFHWHIELMPRLRTYSSFEISAGFPINSVPPEYAASLLRNIS
ncbi:galactose-1-phosphate uridylyltransferase [candidate division KSB1 bacterium]|nr:galactose-1-phosphate uridylyltransferase [candidate division KSB1 bacterium]